MDVPANGFPILMLKSLPDAGEGNATAGTVPAATTTEGHITEPKTPDPGTSRADAGPPAQAAKATGEAGTVTVDLPADMSLSVSPRDLAKLATFKQRLVRDQAAARKDTWDDQDAGEEPDVAKRDMDPNVGGGVDRDKLDDSDFVFPDERDFPVVKPGDVSDAVSSWGRYKGKHSFSEFKSKLTALANRKGKAFAKELPQSWKKNDSGDSKKSTAAKVKQGKKGKRKKAWSGNPPFKGAAPPYKEGNSGEDAPKPGPAKAKKAGNGKAEPQDAKVDQAIGQLKEDAGAALAVQAKDPDATTHPADVKVTEALEHVKDDVDAAAAAQAKDEDTDNPADHAKKSADGPAYHLVRLHDAVCAAFTTEDVVAAHPAVSKGIGHITDPASFGAMVSAALTEDAGTGSRAAELPGLSTAYQLALAVKAAGVTDLDGAMTELRKEFADMYPTAHPKPGSINPGEFCRPYISAGHATQCAKPGQHPRVPLTSHVPSPDDFQRSLITAGREAASPGSAVKAGRTYYTNQAREQAKGVLGAMHDWIADQHPDLCPMAGPAPDMEDAVPGSAGSSVTTAAPTPEKFGKTNAATAPYPVSADRAAAAVTPHVTKAQRKAAKAARKEATKMARKAEKAASAPTAPQPPAIDPELLKTTLRGILAEELGGVTKTIGGLEERLTAMESAPDPAQMTPRSGAASITKARESSGSEVPAGGDEHATERLVRLVKRVKDPDQGVRVAAIGELMQTVGREAAVELLAGI